MELNVPTIENVEDAVVDMGLPTNINSLMDVVDQGNQFDPNFASDLLSAEGEMEDIAGMMDSIGLSSEATNLRSLVGGNSFTDMSMYISQNIDGVLDTANLQRTISNVESALGGTAPSCGSMEQAVGPFLGGRSVLESIGSIKDQIGEVSSLQDAVFSAQSVLALAEQQFSAGGISSTELATAQNALSAAQQVFQAAQQDMSTLAHQITDTMGETGSLIAQAENFASSAQAKLTTFTNALKINSLAKDSCMQALLGAVGSSSLLSEI